MCFGGSPSVQAPPPPPPPPPTLQSPQGAQAADTAKTRAMGAVGPGATILTGPQGLTTPASTTQKSLLGS